MFMLPVQQAVAVGRRRPRGRSLNRQPSHTDSPVEKNLRLNDGQLTEIAGEYHLWRTERTNRPRLGTSERRMSTFLHYLASGGYYRQAGLVQGIAESTVLLHLREVADFFMDLSQHVVSLPQPDEYDRLSLPLEDENGVEKSVIGYIDGTIIRIQRPDHAGDAYFCGRHGKTADSLNVQYVVDKNGRIRHVISGIPGSTHDKTAAEWSEEFLEFLNNLPANTVIIGDAAYRNLHPAVLVPLRGHNLQPAQRDFNGRLKRMRQIVERVFGATELKWRMDQMKENRYAAKTDVLLASKCTVAVCVLHNRYTNFL